MISLRQRLITRTDNRPMQPFAGGLAEFVTIHMTGNRSAGADAAAHANYIATGDTGQKSWHITVDDDEAWQHLQLSEQGWHAGDGAGPGNTTSIGLEICMNAGIDQEKAYANAADVAAQLLKLGHGRSGVVQHHRWSGKDCPEVIRATPGRWERFLEQVKAGTTVPSPISLPVFAELTALQALNSAIVLRLAIIGVATQPDISKVERAAEALRKEGFAL